MNNRRNIQREVQDNYESEWAKRNPWPLSAYDDAVRSRIISMLHGRHYSRILEIGCGFGSFTQLLAPLADHVVAIDVATNAIARAKKRNKFNNVDFQVANVMEYNLRDNGSWDLIVFSETIYCLGCYYTFFDIAWLASELLSSTKSGGYLLLSNCQATNEEDEEEDLRPWIIRTYRDLFLNVGYHLEAEDNLCIPNDYNFETLISLFTRQD